MDIYLYLYDGLGVLENATELWPGQYHISTGHG